MKQKETVIAACLDRTVMLMDWNDDCLVITSENPENARKNLCEDTVVFIAQKKHLSIQDMLRVIQHDTTLIEKAPVFEVSIDALNRIKENNKL